MRTQQEDWPLTLLSGIVTSRSTIRLSPRRSWHAAFPDLAFSGGDSSHAACAAQGVTRRIAHPQLVDIRLGAANRGGETGGMTHLSDIVRLQPSRLSLPGIAHAGAPGLSSDTQT